MWAHCANIKTPGSVLTKYLVRVHEKVRGGMAGCHCRLFPSFPTPWYHSALYLRAE